MGMLTGYLQQEEFLSTRERSAVLAALTSAQCRWDVRRDPTNAAKGRVLQLTPLSKTSESFMRMAGLFASRCWDWLQASGVTLPEEESTDIQCFPVWMEGDALTPPYQDPHVDSGGIAARTSTPLVTTVYYAVAVDLDGGDLIGYRYDRSRALAEEFRIAPKTNAVVALRGEQIHGVAPLRSGRRLSVVTNFYGRE